MKREKRKMMFTFLFLLFLGLGIGYAALTTNLNIDGVSQVTGSRWSIYFDNVQEKTGSVTANSPATISASLTTVTYNITLSEPGEFYEFTVDVINDGLIDAMVDTVVSKLNGEVLTTPPAYLAYSVSYIDSTEIEQYHLLAANSTETYKVRVAYNDDINPEDLPPTTTNLSLKFTVNYVQADENAFERPERCVIRRVRSGMDTYAFRDDTYRNNIKTITLGETINPPENVIASWDYGENENGDVMAYLTVNQVDNTKYDLYIQGDGHLYANRDSSCLFSNFKGVDALYNIEALDTSKVENMMNMFYSLGYNSTVFTLDLGNNFKTSTVVNMAGMFNELGYSNPNFFLNLGDLFDTSQVTDMSGMFFQTGYSSTAFTLDLGDHFDTSKVTNMVTMFNNLGKNCTNFVLDLGDNFDTSNVTNMDNMFNLVGLNSQTLTIDLGDNFDTSNVTNMNNMFNQVGRYATTFSLDLGDHFDTSNVTDFSYMFSQVGASSPTFTIDLGNLFNISKATAIRGMFNSIGNSNNNLELDLSSIDFTVYNENLSVNETFRNIKSSQIIYVKDAANQSWVISHANNSNLTTSNVLIKGT